MLMGVVHCKTKKEPLSRLGIRGGAEETQDGRGGSEEISKICVHVLLHVHTHTQTHTSHEYIHSYVLNCSCFPAV